MLLEVRNLTTEFQYDGKVIIAVDDISFEVYRNEIVGIVGESGSGKSVAALSIMQLITASQSKISSGEIIYHHHNPSADLLKLNSAEMCRFRGSEIAMIFQEPMISLNPVIRCGEQVAEAIMLHQESSKKEAYNKTIELFGKVELNDPENTFNAYSFQLSGGQKQRVMIAMAISCNPQLLIADEPTTALDTLTQKSILDLLKKIQAENDMSIIYITHDLDLIAEFANRVLVMHGGKIVEQGNISDVFSNPQHTYTKELLTNRLAGQSKVARGKEKTEDGMQISILKVKNLKTYFPLRKGLFQKKTGDMKAVDNVSFEVMKGETLGLVGASGCGKTTLARTLLRLIEPTSGSIIFNDVNLTELNRSELRKMRKRIQIIFQDPYSSLNPRLPIGEAIAEPMLFHHLYSNDRECKNKVLDLLRKVGLSEDYFNRLPGELSGGQRQRAVIARALSLNPEFLICDECVSALDVSVQAQVLNLLNELKQELNFTSIFISHDLNVVEYMSDRIMVMKNGMMESLQ